MLIKFTWSCFFCANNVQQNIPQRIDIAGCHVQQNSEFLSFLKRIFGLAPEVVGCSGVLSSVNTPLLCENYPDGWLIRCSLLKTRHARSVALSRPISART